MKIIIRVCVQIRMFLADQCPAEMDVKVFQSVGSLHGFNTQGKSGAQNKLQERIRKWSILMTVCVLGKTRCFCRFCCWVVCLFFFSLAFRSLLTSLSVPLTYGIEKNEYFAPIILHLLKLRQQFCIYTSIC